jgi:hypothetical protein
MRTNIARSLWVVAALGAGCGNVMKPGEPDAAAAADAAKPDAAPPLPDAAPVTVTSCADIAAATPGAPSGTYTIDPDGTGPGAPFSVICEMAAAGGGWTQVTDTLAGTLSSTVNRQYLYLYGTVGYISPCTTDAWTWADNSGQEVTGTYSYFTATTTGTLACVGSAEKPTWGVGCSNGGSYNKKVLPGTTKDVASGASEVWQDDPDAYGTPGAYPVTIFEKEGC